MLSEILIQWLFAAIALLLAAKLFNNVHLGGDFAYALSVAAGYGILSVVLEQILVLFLQIATLGLGFIFLSLTRLVAAAILLKITARFSSRFSIEGFWTAIGTAFLMSLGADLAMRIA